MKFKEKEIQNILGRYSLIVVLVTVILVLFGVGIYPILMEEQRASLQIEEQVKAQKLFEGAAKFEMVTLSNLEKIKYERLTDKIVEATFLSIQKRYFEIIKNYPNLSFAQKASERIKILDKEKNNWKDRIVRWKKRENERYHSPHTRSPFEKTIEEGETRLEQAITFLKKKKYHEARQTCKFLFDNYMKYYRKFPNSQMFYATSMHIPAYIDSEPQGAKVFIQKRFIGETPLIYTYPIKTKNLRFTFNFPGYKILNLPKSPKESLPWKKFIWLKPKLSIKSVK